MPARAAKPCSYPGCRALVRGGSSRCEQHSLKAWARAAPAPERIRGRKLQQLRQALFSREPLCRECAKLGLVTLATLRDHIVPLAEGGTDTEDNEQPLCGACHDLKTQGEAKRGVGRGNARDLHSR